MSRKCPYCGEAVPSYSINCPKCYKSIPREEPKQQENIRTGNIPNDRAPSVHTIDMRVVILLALIPAAIGFMGLAQIYERGYRKGAYFFSIGFVLFTIIVVLAYYAGTLGIASFLAVILMVFFLILYIVMYAIQAFDAIVRSIIPFSIKL